MTVSHRMCLGGPNTLRSSSLAYGQAIGRSPVSHGSNTVLTKSPLAALCWGLESNGRKHWHYTRQFPNCGRPTKCPRDSISNVIMTCSVKPVLALPYHSVLREYFLSLPIKFTCSCALSVEVNHEASGLQIVSWSDDQQIPLKVCSGKSYWKLCRIQVSL